VSKIEKQHFFFFGHWGLAAAPECCFRAGSTRFCMLHALAQSYFVLSFFHIARAVLLAVPRFVLSTKSGSHRSADLL
jgi:hypothetical protein